MVFKNRFIMILTATLLIGGMLIVLFQQSKMQKKELQELLPALSPISVRSEARVPKWMGEINKDGRVYFISFWATWCEPCKEELPFFELLNKKYPSDQFQIRLVNLDYGESSIQEAKKMLAELAPSLTSAYENAESKTSKLSLPALPYHSLIDKKGRVAMSFYAPLAKYQEGFKSRVQELLDEKASP